MHHLRSLQTGDFLEAFFLIISRCDIGQWHMKGRAIECHVPAMPTSGQKARATSGCTFCPGKRAGLREGSERGKSKKRNWGLCPRSIPSVRRRKVFFKFISYHPNWFLMSHLNDIDPFIILLNEYSQILYLFVLFGQKFFLSMIWLEKKKINPIKSYSIPCVYERRRTTQYM